MCEHEQNGAEGRDVAIAHVEQHRAVEIREHFARLMSPLRGRSDRVARQSGDRSGSSIFAADVPDGEHAGLADEEHVIEIAADDSHVGRDIQRRPLHPFDVWQLGRKQAGLQLTSRTLGLLSQRKLLDNGAAGLQAQFKLAGSGSGARFTSDATTGTS